MLYKKLSSSSASELPSTHPQNPKLHLITGPHTANRPASNLPDLFLIAARRCSSFFAEAAVLVLVFGILDVFLLHGRIQPAWVAGALAISLALLAASVAMDFSAHRWIKAHP